MARFLRSVHSAGMTVYRITLGRDDTNSVISTVAPQARSGEILTTSISLLNSLSQHELALIMQDVSTASSL